MATALRIEDLDRLVLVWLAMRATHEGKRAPQRKSLESVLRPHALALGVPAESVARQSLARLRAGGDIDADTTMILSTAGEAKALAALGMPALPKRAAWKWVHGLLVARGLGATHPEKTSERLGTPEALAMAVLQAELKLPDTGALSPAQMGDAVAWRALGVASSKPFTRNAVLEHLVERAQPAAPSPERSPRKQGAKRRPELKQLLRALLALDLGIAPGHTPLQVALVQRWLRGAAGPQEAGRDVATPAARAATPDPPTAAIDAGAPVQSAPPARPATAADEPGDLRTFADHTLAAARSVPEGGRFGEHKVFVSRAWDAFLARGNGAVKDLATFKERLVRANQQGLLRLSRADLVEVMDPADLARSEIQSLGATFHFVRVD